MTKIKICGITNLTDAQVAVESGADYLGFILHPKSPRYVAAPIIREILTALEEAGYDVPGVGVVVNRSLDEITQFMDETGVRYAQLHGDEPLQLVAALEGRGFKALRPATPDDLAQAGAFAQLAGTDGPQLMVDAYSPAAYGGTGHRADWSLARQAAVHTPRLLLAGGLTPDNVIDSMHSVQPWGVDVSSGVEAEPGRKDHAKVRAFIAAVRAADAS